MTIEAVIFDVDGVLLDSLGPHLKICEDKNREYGLGLQIPDAGQFREMVEGGVRISPMKYFFLAVGFPEREATQAERDYQVTFMERYAPAPFVGIESMLSNLVDMGKRLGFVTANVKRNVESALGISLRHFQPICRFAKDSPGGLSKEEALTAAASVLGVPPINVVYVGDQPADWKAATAVGMRFLGVTYGWGISRDDQRFPTVETPATIGVYIGAANEG